MLDEKAIRKRIEDLKDETCERLGLKNVEEFAEAVGMKRSAYYGLVTGNTKIVNPNIRNIARGCGVSEEYLLLGFEPVKEEELREQAFYEQRIKAIREDCDKQIAAKNIELEALRQANEVLMDNKRLYEKILKQEEKSE